MKLAQTPFKVVHVFQQRYNFGIYGHLFLLLAFVVFLPNFCAILWIYLKETPAQKLYNCDSNKTITLFIDSIDSIILSFICM